VRKLIVLSAAFAAAACSDNQSTAPAARSSASGVASPGQFSASDRAVVAQGKPVPQIGFTKTQVVYAAALTVPGGLFNVNDAICPAGTVMVGGGHEINTTFGGTAPLVWRSHPHLTIGDASDGWSIAVDNTQAGAKDIVIQAWAVCAN
jgi:hypothetical protein